MTTRVRVFISYAHDSAEHVAAVRKLWEALRVLGIDARVDLPGAAEGRDWPAWVRDQVRAADYVLVVASPGYQRNAETMPEEDEQAPEAASKSAKPAQWEPYLVRAAVFRNRPAARWTYLPVVLPGHSVGEIPEWLATSQNFTLDALTPGGVADLAAALVGEADGAAPALKQAQPHRLELSVTVEGDSLRTRAHLAGALVCERAVPLPYGLDEVWDSLAGPAGAAEQKMTGYGRRLARSLLDETTLRTLTDLVNGWAKGSVLDVVVEADVPGLSQPYELIRLPDDRVLGTVPSVRFTRHVRGVRRPVPPPAPGPLTVLEVAGTAQIAAGLGSHGYHVLHLSARRASSVDPAGVETAELVAQEKAAVVEAEELVRAIRGASRPVPLVVLSRRVGGRGADTALAVSLIRQGADRVVIMQAPVTGTYGVALAEALYHALADQNVSVAAALAQARSALYAQVRAAARRGVAPARPEYGVATLFTAGDDPPLRS